MRLGLARKKKKNDTERQSEAIEEEKGGIEQENNRKFYTVYCPIQKLIIIKTFFSLIPSII